MQDLLGRTYRLSPCTSCRGKSSFVALDLVFLHDVSTSGLPDVGNEPGGLSMSLYEWIVGESIHHRLKAPHGRCEVLAVFETVRGQKRVDADVGALDQLNPTGFVAAEAFGLLP